MHVWTASRFRCGVAGNHALKGQIPPFIETPSLFTPPSVDTSTTELTGSLCHKNHVLKICSFYKLGVLLMGVLVKIARRLVLGNSQIQQFRHSIEGTGGRDSPCKNLESPILGNPAMCRINIYQSLAMAQVTGGAT